MSHIDPNNHFVAFVIPDNADIHIDAAFKKIFSSLDAFGPQGRVKRVFGRELQLVFKLFLFPDSQILTVMQEKHEN